MRGIIRSQEQEQEARITILFRIHSFECFDERLVACARGDGRGVSFVTQMVMVAALFAVFTGLPELATKNFM